LKEDRDALERLRQKLFVLWGDLEENKTNLLAQKTTKALLSIQAGDSVPSSPESSPEPSQSLSSPPRKLDDMPSDSDDETPAAKPKTNMTRKALQEKDPDSLTAIKKLNKQQAEERLRDIIAELNIKNLGFTACIEEYGVKVPEENESLANAFNGKRWRRTWRMFETTIA
jgi:protection-of-telomeres protein 1